MWDELRGRIGAMPAYAALERRLRDEPPVPVCGLSGSARSLVLAVLVRALGRPAVAIASDPVRARDIVDDRRCFGVERVVPFPEDEILPYDYHDPDRNLTGMQMAALERLSAGECGILVCTPGSLIKKVFAPGVFRELLFEFRGGSALDPHRLAERLVRLGYERHQIVEEKGQFALRGGIFDLFEVSAESPVRLEFDGDLVASLREFDIETQRSGPPRTSVTVHPLHHLAPDAAGLARLREFLDRRAADLDPQARAKAMLPAERLAGGIHFFGMEHYAAIVHDVVPVTGYFDRQPVVAVYDHEDVETRLVELRKEIALRFERSLEENIYPEPDLVYLGEQQWRTAIDACPRIEFCAVPGGDAVRFSTAAAGGYRRNIAGLVKDIRREIEARRRVFFFCSTVIQRERAAEILDEVALEIDFPLGALASGFRWPAAGIVFLSEQEAFGRYQRPWNAPRIRSRSLTYDPSHFKPGDFVVHVGHGIGRYMGMRILAVGGGGTECLDIRYEGDDRLFIPVSQLRMVEKYTAAEGAAPKLARLGGGQWTRARERARRSAQKIAYDLVEMYAARQVAPGFACGPDGPWQLEMEASFPWEETAHQFQATREVKADMERPRPMDRLLCGDVGFGKTEVAVRAAFKAVLAGKQVVLLVPTTVLALQHYNTLLDRLAGFPVRVAMLSRFVPAASRRRILEETAQGRVDIVIGTHRLLSGDVAFADLGLVIVDEEHRFGVAQKEKLKRLKKSVDVLSMTATPIPRTLSMALSGIRDISTIDTPPRNRLPIHTEILPFDDGLIREAVLRETGRGGQVFFVHNRVQSIHVMEGYLRRLLPGRMRIAHAHGQMGERELEKIMIDFLERRFDVLLCTMIIEAGLDFPNVNTIIINRADRFGLAQLYQLRGRVGRSDRKAYAYLLIPRGGALTSAAMQRLQAITEFDYLGAGYRIAMRDLEIRGAGNLLGHQQSGQIEAVGLDLYTRMIREEIARMGGEEQPAGREARISVPVPAYLPEAYVPDGEERMDIYRRLSRAAQGGDVTALREELRDRFGPLPREGDAMLKLVELKLRALAAGIESIEIDDGGRLSVGFAAGCAPDRERLAAIAALFTGRLTFHAQGGFSMTVAGAQERPQGGGQAPGVEDLEKLLNLLEFSCR